MKKLMIALTTTLMVFFSASIYAAKAPESSKVNVNSASVQELDERLVGVGKRIAEEIVRHREAHGPFQSTDDLDKVKFVGAKLIEKNKDAISFD